MAYGRPHPVLNPFPSGPLPACREALAGAETLTGPVRGKGRAANHTDWFHGANSITREVLSMSKFVLRSCQIVINGVNFSDHTSSVEVSMKKKSIDTTNFSGGGTEVTAGLKEDQFVITLQQDFNAAEVDATLYPLYNNENEFVVAVRPLTAAISTTNPEFSATCVLLEYQPLSGKVGELSDTKVTFNAQRSGVARATS